MSGLSGYEMIMLDPVEDPVMGLRSKRAAFDFFVRQASPRILIVLSIVFLGVRISLDAWGIGDVLVAIVIPASWHLQERLIHEYLLHLKGTRFLVWNLLRRISEHHRRHHLDPWRTETLFITTSAYLFNVPAIFGVLLAITRDIRLTLTGVFAYFFTLLCYEWTHCLIHTSYVPRSSWYRRRWWNHRLHHFKDSRYWFGITSPMWDIILRSQPDPDLLKTRKNWRGPNPLEQISTET
jgi:hypothetical protein